MPKFDKNLQIRNDILDTSKKLFYEKGYTHTTFADIASELDITKGLISYYFDSKSNLANQVYHNLLVENQGRISMKFYTELRDTFRYDPRAITVISNLATYTMLKTDNKAKKFFVEYLYYEFCSGILEGNYDLWSIYKHKDKNRYLDDTHLNMQGYASRAASSIIQVSYFMGKLDISFEEFADYTVRLKFKIEGLPEETINEIVSKGKIMFSKLPLTYKPYFVIE